MKQPEIKEALMGALGAEMDSALELVGFRRSPRGLIYSKESKGAKCQFAVEFSSHPGYAPGSLAHLTPALRIANRRVSEAALELVSDPMLLANAPEVIQNQRLTMTTEPPMPEWYVADLARLKGAVEEIRDAFIEHGAPFLDSYSTPEGIIRQHEAEDRRALRQLHYYVYVIAAYVLEERYADARAVLEARFSRPGIKTRYASLWRNLAAGQAAAPNRPATPNLRSGFPVRGSEG